jgi:hypothetical protein
MRLTRIYFATACCLIALARLPSSAETPAPKGYIRFWDMLPPANGTFEVRNAGASNSQGNLLSSSAYHYTSYTQFPPGVYEVGVYKSRDDKPIKIFKINLRPQTFFTILISPQSGVISAEVIDDTNDPQATSGTLTVRNYYSGLTVTVSSDTQKIVDGLSYGQTHVASGLPLNRLQLNLHTRLPNGTPAESGAEADFKASKRATLLIIPDSYGRFCARITIDGNDL